MNQACTCFGRIEASATVPTVLCYFSAITLTLQFFGQIFSSICRNSGRAMTFRADHHWDRTHLTGPLNMRQSNLNFIHSFEVWKYRLVVE
jgi:hypothetical protein